MSWFQVLHLNTLLVYRAQFKKVQNGRAWAMPNYAEYITAAQLAAVESEIDRILALIKIPLPEGVTNAG